MLGIEVGLFATPEERFEDAFDKTMWTLDRWRPLSSGPVLRSRVLTVYVIPRLSYVMQVDILPSSMVRRLHANFVNFIYQRDENVYVGTNNGLFVLSNLNGEIKYTRYGIADGVPDLETNLNSGFFDLEGNVME